MLYRNLKLSSFWFVLFLLSACGGSDATDSILPTISSDTHSQTDTSSNNYSQTDTSSDNGAPSITAESTYYVSVDEDVIYAEGLAHNSVSTVPFAVPLKLDVYFSDAHSNDKPVFMFIHGGGFTGGTKTKAEIVDMGYY